MWKIEHSDEDGHTAIESYLTHKYGEVGKKIHTGRSRNDQSLTMIRLFLKEKLAVSEGKIKHLVRVLDGKKSDTTPMPGYTHLQKAMPTTVGSWFGSFSDLIEEELPLLKQF